MARKKELSVEEHIELILQRLEALEEAVGEGVPSDHDILTLVASRLTTGMKLRKLSPKGETAEKMSEHGVDRDPTSGRKVRVWTDEERKEAGIRLQTARARNLGLTLDQLRFLKLRPGQKPSAAQIKAAQKAHPGRPEPVEETEQPTTKKAKKSKKVS